MEVAQGLLEAWAQSCDGVVAASQRLLVAEESRMEAQRECFRDMVSIDFEAHFT